MLRAHLHGKLMRNGEARDAVRCLEDTATATLFERLTYLPDETLIRILFDPTLWPGLAVEPLPTAVREVSFWPTLPWNRDGDDRKRLEPDIVITFDNRVLVIEAKRFDRIAMQAPDQLAREWRAAHEQHPQTPICLLAVSGLRDDRSTTIEACRREVRNELAKAPSHDRGGELCLGYAPWHHLFAIVERALGDQPHGRRLLSDLRDGLAAHGVNLARPVWLKELLVEPLVKLHPLSTPPGAFTRRHRPLPPLGGHGRIISSPTVFRLPEPT